jgi:hypothetical protein
MNTIRLDSNLEQDDHLAASTSQKDVFTTDWTVSIDDDLLNNELWGLVKRWTWRAPIGW